MTVGSRKAELVDIESRMVVAHYGGVGEVGDVRQRVKNFQL